MHLMGLDEKDLRGLAIMSGWGLSVGEIQWHFSGISWPSWEEGVVPSILLYIAVAAEASVTTTIGIVEGRGDMGVVVNAHKGCTTCGHEVGAVYFSPLERRSMRWAAEDPSKATSNCWIASAWSKLAKLLMWLANLIFWRAWTKRRKSVEHKKVKDQAQSKS